MKVVTKTGLVPVHTNTDPSLFGVPPQTAIDGLKAGTLFLGEIPEGIETFDVADGLVKAVAAGVINEPNVIEIPDDWETMHHAKLTKLAKDLFGDQFIVPDGKTANKVATEMVHAEVDRRAAAKAAAEAETDDSDPQNGNDPNQNNQQQ